MFSKVLVLDVLLIMWLLFEELLLPSVLLEVLLLPSVVLEVWLLLEVLLEVWLLEVLVLWMGLSPTIWRVEGEEERGEICTRPTHINYWSCLQ